MQAGDVLAKSEKLVVIGYSMPVADEAARTLLLGKLNRNAEISLWCGERNEVLKKDFRKKGHQAVEALESARFEDFLLAMVGRTALRNAL